MNKRLLRLLPIFLLSCGNLSVLDETVEVLIQFQNTYPPKWMQALHLSPGSVSGTLASSAGVQLSAGIMVYFMSLKQDGNNGPNNTWTLSQKRDDINALYSFFFENETSTKTVTIPVGRYEIYSIGYKGTLRSNRQEINNNPSDVKCYRSHQHLIDANTVLNIRLSNTEPVSYGTAQSLGLPTSYAGCFQQNVMMSSNFLYSAFGSDELVQKQATGTPPHNWRLTRFKLCDKSDPFQQVAFSTSQTASTTGGIRSLPTDFFNPTQATLLLSDLLNHCQAGVDKSIFVSFSTLYYESIPNNAEQRDNIKHKKETDMGKCLPFRPASGLATDPILLPLGRIDGQANHLIMPLRIDLYSGPNCSDDQNATIEASYLITSPLAVAEDDGNVFVGDKLSNFLNGDWVPPSYEGRLPSSGTSPGRILIFQRGIDSASSFNTTTISSGGTTTTNFTQTSSLYGATNRTMMNTVFLRKF